MPEETAPLIVGVPKETFPGECRVAAVPATVALLARAGCPTVVERGAGLPAGFPDAQYEAKGATFADSRREVIERADVIFQVRAGGAAPESPADYRPGQILVAQCDPFSDPQAIEALAKTGVSAFALELLPRITRAQSMDVLSSMATVAGYKAVVLAADALPRMFPMLMTAAGTVSAAKVFVVGAGVAGLQAIATAKRLGAIVRAYDVRPVVKEQVESLGGKFVELGLETAGAAEGQGGYAREMGEEFLRRQREVMTQVVAESDVVITTAAVPGKQAPVLVTAVMVHGMAPGSVIVDLAAERGGNCELTRAGETVEEGGVTVLGPVNLAAAVPYHASEMYAKNLATFLAHLKKTAFDAEGKLDPQTDDEIIRETLVAHGGEVVHPGLRDALNK